VFMITENSLFDVLVFKKVNEAYRMIFEGHNSERYFKVALCHIKHHRLIFRICVKLEFIFIFIIAMAESPQVSNANLII